MSVLSSETGSDITPAGVGSLRFVTSNLLNGRSLDDGAVDVDRMVRSLSALAPHVLGMQEVDHHQARSGSVGHTAAIAAAIPGASWRFVPAIVGEPGVNWRPATVRDAVSGHDIDPVDAPIAAFGSALITTLPVVEWHVIRVPPFPRRAPVFIPGMNQLMFIDDEPRVCVAAVVRWRGELMTVAATHASFVPGWNVMQLRRITKALRTLPGPRVLLGDLNLPAPFPSGVSRWRSVAARQPTFPSPSPRLQLDHALLDDPGCRFDGSWRSAVHRLPFSDHLAVAVDYSDPTGSGRTGAE